jgi:hypothetical protein
MTSGLPVLLGEPPAIAGLGVDADLELVEFEALLLQRLTQPGQVPLQNLLDLLVLSDYLGLDPALLYRQVDFNPPQFLRLQLDAHAVGFVISVDGHAADHLVKNLTFSNGPAQRLLQDGAFR